MNQCKLKLVSWRVFEKVVTESAKSLDQLTQFITNVYHLDKSIKDIEFYIKVSSKSEINDEIRRFSICN